MKDALDGFIERTQTINGAVRIKLHRGSATVVGRSSSDSLYDPMATWRRINSITAPLGFITSGLPRLWAAAGVGAATTDEPQQRQQALLIALGGVSSLLACEI